MSSIASLTSSSSYASGSSEFSVDAYSYNRDYQEEGTSGSGHDESRFSSVKNLGDMSLQLPNGAGFVPSNVMVENICHGSMDENAALDGTNTEIISNSLYEENKKTRYHKPETDHQFWLPPEAEYQENDMEGSVTNYDDDDDDEFGDGTEWGKPSSLSSLEEQGSGSYKYKEEKQKALDEVMNCKFRALVGHLLNSIGVVSSDTDGGNWVDIVTSLSWEAASFVKLESSDGKAMDPDGYVKVKCIATGCPSESQMVKGMVFKKHAAHKHMPSKYKNPRLLLIQGALDLSLSGLSSFEEMNEEKDTQKTVIETIEMCHPNVILVEKTVSRDIQETLLAKGMTLVYDMNLNRLQRVARCTGSAILSSETLTGKKLRQCDSFHFEKFVEEHAGDNGKKSGKKTLMFLEGCPTRMGCTILLKGTNSDELKKIKVVVQHTVLVAYHLILETAFFLDQRAMFHTLPLVGMVNPSLTAQIPSSLPSDANGPFLEKITSETDSPGTVDIHISNGFHEEVSHDMVLEGDTLSCHVQCDPLVFSGDSSISASIKEPRGYSVSLLPSSNQHVYKYLDTVPNDQIQVINEVSASLDSNDHSGSEEKSNSVDETALSSDGKSIHSQAPSCAQNSCGHYEDQEQVKDDTSRQIDDDGILVLMSLRNSSTGTVCEQSRYSRIKFYRNFDVSLGVFLRDKLLNQSFLCNLCGGSPEAHIYNYAHHNKQLTIQVRRMEKHLPGETEGKIWMWSRCGNCNQQNGNVKSTKRVLISAAARGLSFGKFLELSLSENLPSSRSSSCGHQFHMDFLYFFGLGKMVAMLRYSPITTYSVTLPPAKLKLAHPIRGESFREEYENISNMYEKGIGIFLELEKSLKDISSRFLGAKLNIRGSMKEFTDIEDMLKQEREQFEADVQSILRNWKTGDAVYKLISLNQVQWGILLESCVWDRRLHALLSSEFTIVNVSTQEKPSEEHSYLFEIGTAVTEVDGVNESEEVLDNVASLVHDFETYIKTNEFREVPIQGEVRDLTENDSLLVSSVMMDDSQNSSFRIMNNDESWIQNFEKQPNVYVDSQNAVENATDNDESVSAQSEKIGSTPTVLGDVLDLNLSERNKYSSLLISNLENSEGWIWSPFTKIRDEYMKDLQKGYSLKFEPINAYAPGSLVHEMIIDEGSRLHIPLGTNNYIISDSENELSSVIACALALLKNSLDLVLDLNDDMSTERGVDAKAHKSSRSLTGPSALSSSNSSTFSSFTSDGKYSSFSSSSEDFRLSTSNVLYLLDSLVYSGDAPHPEVCMGLRNIPGKGKYSIISLFAREFQDLRRQCCLSEIEYIASLTHCKDWDAKGGKSKSFFAKTLDEHFIIKEIKRIEYESFIKLAPGYFKHMRDCFELGNQTCLAKIFGIHQVIVRKKNGKEMRHELMVMENLTFGRKVDRQYDLKGALHARLNSAPDGSGNVLLDQNFINDMNNSPLYVGTKAKRNLQRAVWNDTAFLKANNVMDYSLLVGVDTGGQDIVCGIIDYLRQYTWDKQFEHWVKSSLVVPKNQSPTVISPIEYKKRFRNFIDTRFLTVPDHWGSPISTKTSCNDDSSSFSGKSQRHEDQDSVVKSPEQGET